MFEYQINTPQQPAQKMLIFLHGYNDSVANYRQIFDLFCQNLPLCYVAMPQSPEICDKNPQQRQWFGMQQYDPQNRRINPLASVQEIFEIYQKAAADINKCAAELNIFIDELQKKYNISDSQTYLAGFSQGAMLTLYTALSRQKALGGAFVLSGLAAGRKLLAGKIAARPPLYLFHGKDDLKVQYKTLDSTVLWLKKQKITPQIFTYDGLTHHINMAEITQICSIINQE